MLNEVYGSIRMMGKNKSLLIIISSPSGAGKTTIAKKVVQKDSNLALSISYTTRPPRKSEKEGEDYCFVSRNQFSRMKDEDKFLEWAMVHGECYGTSRDFVERGLSSGKDVVLVIDVKGAKQVREKCKDCVSIFILPPSIEELKQRLINRETETEEEIAKRMEIVSWEQAQSGDYDYSIVNDKIDKTVERVLSIIKTERNKRK